MNHLSTSLHSQSQSSVTRKSIDFPFIQSKLIGIFNELYKYIFSALFKKELNSKEKHILQNIIDGLHENVIILDKHYTILSSNEAANRAWGNNKTEKICQKLKYLLVNESISAKSTTGEFIQIKLEKETIEAKVKWKKVIIGKNEVFMMSINDISQQVKTDKELLNKKEEIEMLLYKSSHSLRNPLTSILGLVTLLKSTDITKTDHSNYLHLIELTVNKLDNELKKLDNFKTIISEPLTMDFCYFQNICRDVIEDVVEIIDDEPIFFEIDPCEKSKICTDVHFLKILMNQLIMNSIQFRKTNENTKIQLFLKEYEDCYKILVSDNGEGIQDNVRPYIFDMYYRGHKKSEGSGLGLYLVKKGLEKLNGKIELKSTVGVGTTFMITLPKK